MKGVLLSLALLVFQLHVAAQEEDSVRHRVYLVGDAGALYGGKNPVIDCHDN